MKRIVGAALGNDVHVAGLVNFLMLARSSGYETRFLGPAVAPELLVQRIAELNPDIVAVSYRLTPEVAAALFAELKTGLARRRLLPLRLFFGGTPRVAEQARASGMFERIFDGSESPEEITACLRGEVRTAPRTIPADTLVERIAQNYPRPLLRHHFGRPSLRETIAGAGQIAESGVLDVLSLGPDQNAQQSFFRPHEIDPTQDGAGGVPLRHPDDLRAIYAATRNGNRPLVRCYAGTRDLRRWAEMSVATIHNAWGAIPLCWYSQLDGRSNRPLPDAIIENRQTIAWYAEQGLPVEVNESHQWSLRSAHDSLAVATAYLAACNARALGVRHYVSQYMFNTPAGTAPAMDLAKMLAKIDLIEGLHTEDFLTFRQVRAGLAHFLTDPDTAKGQLAASAVLSMSLRPHILHVVGYSEGDHLVTAAELIESCRIVRGVLHDIRDGLPDMTLDPEVQRRRQQLVAEARILLEAIRRLGTGSTDPLTDPEIITRAVRTGLLDAPHLVANPVAQGRVITGRNNGGFDALDPESLEPLGETERIERLSQLGSHPSQSMRTGNSASRGGGAFGGSCTWM